MTVFTPDTQRRHHVYTFWQATGPMPAYLKLCVATWYKYVPNLQVEVVNHDNWHSYVGHLYDLESLKTFSLPMQSDAISAGVLAERGGLFLDIDTIVTQNFFDGFVPLAEDRFVAFGRPNHKSVHLAILKSMLPGNPLACAWLQELQRRISNRPPKIDWSYLGNGIIDPLLRAEKHFYDYLIIDRAAYGNILEAGLTTAGQPSADYLNFYFDAESTLDAAAALSAARYGLISLHNSWTPANYKQLSGNHLLEDQRPITRMFAALLGAQGMRQALTADVI